MKMRWFTSLLASAILSSLLSGCLVSKTPLITAANCDQPLPAHFLISHDGTRENTGRVDLADDKSYVFVSPGDSADEMHVYFKKIADNVYAASHPMIVKETGELRGYQYGYMQVAADGSKIVFQWPDCQAFDPAEIEKMGVEIERDRDGTVNSCHIPSVDVLGTLLTSYMSDPKNAERIKSREEDGTFYVIKQ